LVILSACLCLLQKDGKNIHTVVIRDMPRYKTAGTCPGTKHHAGAWQARVIGIIKK
jgi:hypothetical protein